MTVDTSRHPRPLPAMSGAHPREILEYAVKQWGDQLMMTTAFGYSGMILMHMLREIEPKLPVYFINTGFHFEATLKFRDFCRDEWGINIVDLNPEQSNADFLAEFGDDIMKRNADFCCNRNKVRPLQALLEQEKYSAWISALRRDQADTRKNVQHFEELNTGMVKVHPLVEWDKKQVWKYINDNNVPFHPMHDEGYMSIGCAPCTSLAGVNPGAGERDGRWAGTDKIECGLHMIGKEEEKQVPPTFTI